MRQDVWLNWVPYSKTANVLFSQSGARTFALNWGVGVACVGLMAVGIMALAASEARRRSLPGLALVSISLGFLTAGAVYLTLPRAEIRLVKNPSVKAQHILYALSTELTYDPGKTNRWSRGEISRAARDIITVADTNAMFWNQWVEWSDWSNWQNYFLGGPIHEEDSPGNYTFRQAGDRFEFVAYDAGGAPNVLGSVPTK
jgi:hypothetical protein